MLNFIKKNRILFFCFLMPILMLSALFIVKGVYPFGAKSNLMWDMEIQYTDFFSFYKNVLLGNADISYSFSKSLGGSVIALWGYYLSSPVNLLVVFFEHSEFQLFVFTAMALKLGLCGLTFGIFLKSKYSTLSELYTLFFAVAYAFTQYGVGQISNIMWLDGMYMLPLILIAADKYIAYRKVLPLYITVALSVIFNWYTAYMNCIFVMIYFCCSYVLSVDKISFKPALKALAGFAAAEISGVLASCFIFFPVLVGQSGGRTVFDKGIFKFETNGSLLEALRGFMLGSSVGGKSITLFCSLFALMAVSCYFLNKTVSKREKTVSCIFLSIMVASMFFDPINHIWVGFKFEYNFSYRFLYTALAAFLTVAAREMSLEPTLQKRSLKVFLISSVAILLVLDMISRFVSLRLWVEIAVLVIYTLIFLYSQTTAKMRKSAVTIALTLLFFLETAINAYWLTDNYFESDSEEYITYVENETALINQIKSQDNSFYRMEKTISRNFSVSHDSFYCNESMAYNYSGIQHYSSSYDNITGQTLVNLGYCREIFPTFFHDPILGVDSLLGVKYILSEKQYDGYTLRNDLKSYNQKSVYENSYAMPLAFYANKNVLNVDAKGKNPFEYLNEIYSGILGKDIAVYTQCGKIGRSDTSDGSVYTVSDINENQILYTRLKDSGSGIACNISIDGEAEKPYQSGWLNHNVAVIGSMKTEHTVTVSQNGSDLEFYALDLNKLKQISDKINENSVSNLKVFKNEISFIANGNDVMLTVPFDESWSVTVNGKPVTAHKGADAFMFIPLDGNSENRVVMKYHNKGIKTGIALSTLSVFLVFLLAVINKKQLTKPVAAKKSNKINGVL